MYVENVVLTTCRVQNKNEVSVFTMVVNITDELLL